MRTQLTIAERERLLKIAKSLNFISIHAELPSIAPANRGEHLPLSFAQQRLWFLAQMEGVSGAYHVPGGVRLRGALDVATLRRALDRILTRHEALRTTFVLVEGEPAQRIGSEENSHFQLLEHDLRQHVDAQDELGRLADQEARTSFDLETGPLVRGRLIRLADNEHALLITLHHIVSDGWSMGVLVNELSVLYGAFLYGEADPLPELAIQYADYAMWQRQWIEGDILQRQTDYWKTTLTGAPALLELPADHSRPVQQDYVGAFAELVLDEKLTAGLKDLSRRHNATLYMTLLAAWGVLLARLSGQQDIVIGSPAANRNRMEIEGLIGFFVNTLALRLDLSGSQTVDELLQQVKQRALDAQTHQDIPFEQIVEVMRPVRSLAHSPLFQAVFAWQNTPQSVLSLPGLELIPLGSSSYRVAKFDLTLTLQDKGQTIAGGVEYATSLFEAATIERWLGYFRTLLQALVEADASQTIDQLSLLSASERHQVLYEWNDTKAAYPSDRCIHELFEEQVSRDSDAVAVIFEDQKLSYGELNRQANQLAHYLRELGVGPDTRVAICVERGFEMVVALLAVLKAGGAYVPLDPAYPTERLHFMLDDSSPIALLTQNHLRNLFPQLSAALPVLSLDTASPQWQDQPETNPALTAIGLKPHHLAYIIYTSGSTGTPKGVMVEHGQITVRLFGIQESLAFCHDDITPNVSSSAFDISLLELLLPMMSGGQIHMTDAHRIKDMDYFIEQTRTATVFNAVASLMDAWSQYIRHEDLQQLYPRLRTLLVGGESVSQRLIDQLSWCFPNAQVLETYGPTEATLYCTSCIAGTSVGYRILPPIGRPLANTQIYILDVHGEPVPVGVAGELYIGGAGVARGYLNRPELTAEKFLVDPFSPDPDARMYRTGDLGRWLADGNIEFLGRNDFQVKIRGFRIELGEIEARLAEYPAVREAVVLAREDTPGDQRLVAYYTSSEEEGSLSVDLLRSHLSASLPEYMVPAAYVRLVALPLTSNGKLDRRALPAPDSDAYATHDYVPPQGETETILAAIWADLLKIDRVGRHDNFFTLGGHSLLAITLIERLRRVGLQIDVRAIFATPTVAGLAAAGPQESLVDVPPNQIFPGCEVITPEMLPLVKLTAEEIERIVASVPGGAANVQDIYPLAPLQEGLLFHHLIGGEGDPYLLVGQFSFDTRARLEEYLNALQLVIERHDILRTAILWEGLPEPVQVVLRKATLRIEEVQLDPVVDDVSQHLHALFNPRQHRIDIREAPLLRVYLTEDLGAGSWVMMILHHHLMGDHTTMEVIQSEIQAHRFGHADRLSSPLPFRNLVAQARLGVSQQEHEVFFRKMLGDVEEPTAPFGLLDVQGDGTGIKEAHLRLDAALAQRLRSNAKRLGVSMASLCHLAWANVLAKTSGRRDVVFGTVLFGRMQGGDGSDRVMGPFINTLPIRISIGEEGVEASVRTMHALLAGLMRHEHASLALAQRCSAVPAPAPLFSALLNYRHSSMAAQTLSVVEPEAMKGIRALSTEERTSYPFTLSVDDLGQGFILTAQTQASVEAMRVCEFMHTALASLAEALESAPQTPVRMLEVLPASERHQVLYEWNDTKAAYPSDRCIHELFEEQVSRDSDAVAVIFEDQKLSYGELNRQANQLAHYLRELGVGPDTRVAICVERGFEMVVALLAVLKAGGAYVPLDPAYPTERLHFMLDDSSPIALLTQNHLRNLFPQLSAALPVLSLDTASPQWQDQPETNPALTAIGLKPHHLAYIIYTSGSTGTPKGVMVEHGGLSNYVNWALKAYRVEEGDGAPVNTSLAFDATITSLYLPLLVGKQVTLLPGHEVIESLQELLLDHSRFSLIKITPSHLKLLNQLLPYECHANCANVFVIGGEPMHFDVLRLWQQQISETRLINEYGPTETVVGCCVYDVPRNIEALYATIPIGRPIANTQIYILDVHGEPVPVGVAGELYIGGAGVARGYLNRPELTAEKFLVDPFSSDPDARMYRTGDLGRWLADGNIEFLGRNDFQVKIRGFRIELGEIEARLAEYPAVREAVVLAREDTPGDQRLVAYYTSSEEEGSLSVDLLRSHLSASLPEYMVPAAYVQLVSLPLTSNGKLDRRALPAPDSDAYATHDYVPPQGETETILAAIWADLLKIDRVGRHDNFFTLGGHSLLAVRVTTRLRQVLGVESAIRDLFVYPVLADFARSLSSAIHAELPSIAPANRGEHLPLSFAQQRLWFLAQMEGVSGAYHVPGGVRLRGALDVATLRRALDRILTRHEALRTTFVLVEGEPAQRIGSEENSHFQLLEHDLRQHVDAQDELGRLADQEARTSFDLETGPLVRGRLIRLADNEHALLITLHHIVSDGWSMGVLVNELSVLYGAFLYGEADPLPELAIQYADYAMWQRQWIEGDILQRQTDYWKTTLTGAPALLELPADHSRPVQQDYVGAFAELVLDEKLTAGLKDLSRRHNATLYMTLLAAWGVLLARLSGQQDIVIGSPAANRNRMEIEGLIGFFVNTLALRLDLSGSQTVDELLQQVKQRALDAQTHQDIPFEQIVEVMRPVRSLAHSPLFQAVFAWQNTPQSVLSLPGLELIPLGSSSYRVAKFDLTLTLQDKGQTIAGGVEYATSLFEAATIERWLGYFRTLLQALVEADASQTIDQLSLLSASERHQVLYEWNDTKAAYPSDRCIHELFEEQVSRDSDAVAVIFEDQKLSYGELNRQANQLAHYLRELGVGPDTRVAICVERGFEMVVALLAVLKAGGAYVPLDPAYPTERLHFMLDDSSPIALLTQNHLRNLFPQLSAALPVLSLDTASPQWQDQPETNPALTAIGLKPHHLAYIIYTSGSTGTPKGVMVEHGNLSNLICWHCNVFALKIGQHSSSLAGFGFDAATWEIWPTLCVGAALVLPSSADLSNPERLLIWWKKQRLDISFLPTPMAEVAFDQDLKNLQLHTLLVGGDKLRRLPGSSTSFVLINNYGPTESTVVATSGRIEKDVTTIPIGRPIANTQIYILDVHGEPVPVGVAGELYIGGAGVARGYLNRLELTAEKFLVDPFSPDPDARMYRTGDLGRWLADGNIEFLGRNDFQVKIRGFRIELGEIEARLAEYPAVREAVVLAREDTPGDQRLVAYYTSSEEEGSLSVDLLRSHLSASLPEYMVPAAYVRLVALPLTSNGKLDRRALPAPDSDAYATHDYVPPQGETETILAAIWADLLKIDRVGRHDNFFTLGGHSLLAVRVTTRLRQVLGVESAIRDLFVYPVLADFARSLSSAIHAELPSIAPANRGEHLPLSFAQQRLWFLAQMEGVSGAYHVPGGVRLRGALDVATLRRALDRILTRHEALRTTFVLVEGEPAQRIGSEENSHFQLLEHDLRQHVDAQDELGRLADQEARTSFDLETGPLVRGRLIRLADNEHALLITLHHIVSDGWSMGVLVNELSVLYGAFLYGEADPLPELAIQYADYAMWQRQWIEGDILQRQTDYWKTTLTGAPALLELPADHSRPVQQDYVGAFAELVLDEKLTAGLKDLSRRHNATLYMTLLAAWGVLLARLSGQQDIVIGSPAANRNRMEIEGLIGFFVNTLALRLDLSGSQTVDELLQQVKQRALDAQTHQDIPFEQIVEVMRPVRSLAHSPLFQAVFAWQNTPQSVLSLPGLELIPLGSSSYRVAKFDLTLTLQDKGQTIAGGVEYATSLFEAATIERWLGYFRTLLQALVEADASQTIDQLSLLSASERHQVLYEWNDTKAAYPSDRCIHELFEEQVSRDSDAVAVIFEDQKLSYGELNRQANQLAHYLRELGVGPDTRVAICVERGFEMVVALLAVLKAGGAYVPLDPAYPTERLHFMLDDSSPIALLTQNHLRNLFPQLSAALPVLSLDTASPQWQDQPETNPALTAIGLKPHHLAYIIYTSGSTGTPKGVMVEHGQITVRLFGIQESLAFCHDDITPNVSSSAFDISLLELLLPMMSGGQIHMTDAHRIKDMDYFIEQTRTATVFNAVASLMDAWSQYIRHEDLQQLYPRLRTLLVGGESVSQRLIDQLSWCFPNAQVLETYGPTEATLYCTSCIAGTSVGYRILPPIGRPLANTQIYILDVHGEPVPVGVAGELYIGGAGVARGYLNRPELTAEKFLVDPFSPDPDARMYRTGDLGRWLADGNIEFLGRNDFQVKIRGFRIELGEIEARLAEYPAVREAVVLAREDTPGDQRLVAYYTSSEEEGSLSVDLLRSHLSASLPEYMVPAAYVRLVALPLTSNGKLDRRALPAPDSDAYATHDYVPPQGETETILAAIWADLLKIDRVGRHDNFFTLGGHSLLAITLIERLRRVGLQIDVRAIFATPTVAGLAAAGPQESLVDVPPNQIFPGCEVITPEMLPLVKLTAEEIERIVASVPGGAANVQDIYPLAPLQEGLLFHHLIGGEGDPYLLVGQFSFDTRARLEEYLNALQLVIERHDILRTAILWEGLPEPVQVVLRKAVLSVEEITLDPTEANNAAEQMYAHFHPRHFRIDVQQAPLLRIYIANDRKNRRWLMLQHQHHLMGDHSTGEMMQQEIEAYLLKDADRLSSPLPFRNLVAQARLGVSQQEHEVFFRKMLGDVEEPTAPFGLLDVQGDGTGIKEAHLRLDAALAQRLRSNAKRLGVSMASLCHLAWANVLAKTSGRRDVVFGTVLFGRMQGGDGSDRVMGLFINTLPIRISIGEEGVEASVRTMHALLAGLMRHEHASLALAQRCSAVPAPAPLFSALLNYRHSSATAETPSAEALQACEGMQILHREERNNYPFTLSVDDMGTEFGLKAQTQASVEAMRVCEFMHTALASLAEALESAPQTPVRMLEVLPASERHQVLYEWNDTKAAYPSDRCIHELFEEQVSRDSDAVAVIFEDQKLSYGELNRQANQLAHYLRELGVGPDTRVAICVERGFEMVVALLAVLKAGGAYVPLDPAYPTERLHFMLDDSSPIALLTQNHLRNLFPQLSAALPVLSLDTASPQWQDQPKTNPALTAIGLKPHHLAYIIYTSGSTGTPKGVMVEHGGVVNRLIWMQYAYELDCDDDAVLQKTPFSFDVSVWELFWPLLFGAKLVMARRDEHTSPNYLIETIRKNEITIVHFVPSMLQVFLEQADETTCSALSHVVCSGEALPATLARRWQQQFPNTLLHNLYGPTEATVDATAWTCPSDIAEFSIPIGRPIANTQIYILDVHGEPVPVGVAGELYIGGAGVARGYLNRPELTAEKFLVDSFSPDPDARMYRTGDLGRWLADGNIEFLGRNDFQVKIRGFRIELGEIEARLAEYPAVREAVVLAREDTPGDQRLVAYYTSSEEEGSLSVDLLRSHLSASLPEYMVPAAYVRLVALPLTSNGKLDRRALPAPDSDAYATHDYVPPQGETETILAAIWADLLKIDRVGRHDNFFTLGGHSLLAITLIERLRRVGLQIDVRAIFATPTVAGLAAAGPQESLVDVPPNQIFPGCEVITPEMLPLVKLTAEEIERIVASVPGGAANVQDIYPLAPLQEGLLFHHLIGGEGDPYLLVGQFSFDTRARLEEYLNALQLVIERHDILRTAILWEGLPEPVQVVLRKATLRIEEVQLDPVVDDVSQHLHALFNPRQHRIDIREAPLLRVYIANDRKNRRWLMLQHQHHLMGDHTTMEVIQNEIQAHRFGHADRLSSPLPFRNLVAQARLGVSQQEHEVFFRKMLGDVEEPTAPFGLLDVQGDGTGIKEAHLRLDAALAQRLRSNAKRLGVSMASLCHLAWANVLAKTSGRRDVVFGTVLFGRMQGGDGSDRVMGLFINTLPIRISIGEEGVEASVRTMHALLAGLMRHEHASLALAQRCSAVPAPAPLFSALLNYRHSSATAETPSAEALQACEGMQILHREERNNYPFTLSVDDMGTEFGLKAQTQASVEAMRVCEFMHTALASLAEALESAPQTPVRMLEVLPASERHQVLYEWNDTKAAYPSDRCIHELFEEQVSRDSDAVAVIFEDQKLSYGELNRQANQLAHYLRELGVGPDTRVAICVERGFEMVVALLAVLKAGGAYVPLDPAYPTERLHFMLDDSSPIALLTQNHLRNLFPQLSAALPVLSLDTASPQWQDQPETNPALTAIGLKPHHLAYIIYTSGSTGTPKGVMVEHGNLSNYLLWAADAYYQQNASGSPIIHSIGFDGIVTTLYAPLISGQTLTLLQQDIEMDSLGALSSSETAIYTLIKVTPSHLRLLNQKLALGEHKAFTRTLMIGGEVLIPIDILFWQRRFPGVRLINHFGPTEATVGCCTFEISDVVTESYSIPIGRPIANTQIYILDVHGEPVPVGVAGELYIGGAGVARGYLNRPELTAEKFLVDPFSPDPDARMYRTGDLGRWLADGNIEFLGRNDFQVKIRGFRIELGEIEARLAEYPAVREAVVLAREDTPGDQRLVAYYTSSEEEGSLSVDLLRSHLSASLPEYMVPAAYVRLVALPLTSNGKLDRRALPAPDSDAYATHDYVPPQGETETILAAIWADLLKIDRVGRHDNFFTLGGHSLLAVRAVSLLQGSGINISVIDFFTYPTTASLAEQIGLQGQKTLANRAICIRGKGRDTPLFLTHSAVGALAYLNTIGGLAYLPVLAPHIDTNIPIYGLPPINPDESPTHTIEGTAARMVQIIRAVQPNGPYRVAGWSFGGLLAYEIAAQLLGADQSVEFLGIIDTAYYVDNRSSPKFPLEMFDEIEFLMTYLTEDAEQGQLSRSEDHNLQAKLSELRSSTATHNFASFVTRCQEMLLISTDYTVTQLRQYLAYLHASIWSKHFYYPQQIPIPVHLFAAQDHGTSEHLLGWHSVIPEDRLHIIPARGTHRSMMSSPHVEELGKTLSAAIRDSARLPNISTERRHSPLVTLRAGPRNLAPLFCVPGAGASVTSFVELVPHLGDQQTIYGLEPRGLDLQFIPHSTVLAAAECYLQSLSEIYREGPVHLLGHSFGGWIIFEMAQRLLRTGRTIASVTILDSEAPGNCGGICEYTNAEATMEWINICEQTLEHSLGITLTDLNSRTEQEQLGFLHHRLVDHHLIPRRSTPDILRGPLRTFAASLRAAYEPSNRYLGQIHMILVNDPKLDRNANLKNQADLVTKWKAFAPNLIHTNSTGNHVTMLKLPHAALLGQLIEAKRKDHR